MIEKNNKSKPLADKMRPRKLNDFLGQEEVIGENKLLRKAIVADNIPSMIFWGPPGTGKTTLAMIIAARTKAEFLRMSAVTSGMKELRSLVSTAESNKNEAKRTILFLDEIHRWNKVQQDALLPHVENGTIILIGATTENPSFEVRSALLSRCRVFVLKSLAKKSLVKILKRAIKDKKYGLGKQAIKIDKKEIELLASMSNGDARTALNILDYASQVNTKIDANIIKEAFQESHLMYDKNGDEHFNIISALHKSMRGSDPDASLYWLARMLEAGENPLYIARRIVRFASEDIGLANSRALEQAVAVYQACHFIGMPECNVILAQAVVYMAKCEKSNDLYVAYKQAARDVRDKGNLAVPMHIRNAPTKLTKNLGYGDGYKYNPDYDEGVKQEYLPEELKGRRYFK